MNVITTEFAKAINQLESALNAPKNDLSRDASIQRFEFTVELAWKTAKKVMSTTAATPRQVVREMGQAGMIDDVSFWFLALENRILSSHKYKEELAEKVYDFAKGFCEEAKKLLIKLEAEIK